MPVLADLLSQYPIITSLSAFVSTSDLHHLALTSHACRAPIARSFERLMRDCLCDGRGLKMRQNFEGPYWCRDHDWGGALRRSIGSGASFDEPVEVRIWNTVCDTAEALPCLKCGINICEECRVYRREDVHRSKPHRRPHLSSIVHAGQRENLKRNLIYLCPECDVAMEQQILQGHQFLNHLCDCDRYRRWICIACAEEEDLLSKNYRRDHTTWNGNFHGENFIPHNGFAQGYHYSCICGASVPPSIRPRCAWCTRRHLPESEWPGERREVDNKQPVFDEMDPCFPSYLGRRKPYPKLAYDGPIWTAPKCSTPAAVEASALPLSMSTL